MFLASNYEGPPEIESSNKTDKQIKDERRELIFRLNVLIRITSYNVCYTKLLRFWNYFIPENPEGLVNSNEKEQSTCNVSKGDILITRTSESLEEVGMTAVALKDYPNSTFNGFSKRLRLKKDAPIEIFV